MGGPPYIYSNQFCGKSKRCQISLSTLLLIALIVHRGDLRNFELDLLGSSHREFWLRNGKGIIIGLWNKYILLFECRQNQGKNNF